MYIHIIALLISFTVSLYAKTDNFIDNGYKKDQIEIGKHFYQDELKEKKKEMKVENLDKLDNKKLLIKLIQKLDQNNKELKKIKLFINPNEAHYMINKKGKRCLSNSSPDCIDIPVIQEGRNVPALYNFIKNPNQKNARNWLLVQAKLFNHYIRMGYALKFAALNGDENAYPVNALNVYSMPKENITSELYKEKILSILDQKKEEIGTLIFLGKSPRIEKHWGYSSVAMNGFKKGKYYNFAIVFDTYETKEMYDNYFKNMNDIQLREVYNKYPKVVSEKLFKKYKISMTPTAVAVYKNNDKKITSVIDRGYLTQSTLLHAYQNFLVYYKIVEQKEFHTAKIWNMNLNKESK